MGSAKIGFILVFILLLICANLGIATTRILHAQEGDFIKIVPQAVDLDQDKIHFTFSAPLDEKGEWQTTYDDAGQYEIDVTASDEINQSVQKILLIVDNKNQAPVVAQHKITIKETQTVDLKSTIIDPDSDALSYVFAAPFDRAGTWKTKHGDVGNYLATFTVSDAEFTTTARVEVEVLQSNLLPTINHTFSESTLVTIKEDQTLSFFVEALDDEKLTYKWDLDGKKIGEEAVGKYYFDFESAGEHPLTVTVSDGTLTTTKKWTIKVENTNRVPHLTLLPITIKEGEKAVIPLPKTDEDGDTLTYSFQAPFNPQGEWQTTYDDTGTYKTKVTVSDGQVIDEQKIQVTVVNVDRAPVLQLPASIDAYEGQKLLWKIATQDPDEEDVKPTIDNLPTGAVLNQKNKTVIWTPPYDAVSRRGGLLSNILNSLRLEQYFLHAKNFPVTVKSCGKDLCTTALVNIIVHNVNQVPILTVPAEVTVKEGETLKVEASSYDPDLDIVRHYFTTPFGKRSGAWKTSPGDRGIYTSYITATDGKSSDTRAVTITVLKLNRAPTLNIKDDDVTVNEGQQFAIGVTAADPDNDNLTITLPNPPTGATFTNGVFLWTPGFNSISNKTDSWINKAVRNSGYFNKRLGTDKAVVWLQFSVSDGEMKAVHPVKVTIKNVNQKPEIVSFAPKDQTKVQTNQPVLFNVVATDQDNDQLQYTWEFQPDGRLLGEKEKKVTGTSTIERTFVSAGTKTVKVTVRDGWEQVEKEWKIEVEEVPTQADENQEVGQEVVPESGSQPTRPVFKVYIIKK